MARDKRIKKVAYSFVMADLLHYGHIKLLGTGHKIADYHICGLISDEACIQWQGLVISTYDERKKVLERLDCVDEVIKQETMDPLENIKKIHKRYPDAELLVIHGDDWKSLPGSDYVKKIGGRVVQPEYYKRLSRDAIANRFKESTPYHPLKHEHLTRNFMLGNIYQFAPEEETVPSILSTKAETLKKFKKILTSCHIEPIFAFTVGDFKKNKKKIVDSISASFKGSTIIVRSSSLNEDQCLTSKAGCYVSVSDVRPEDKKQISSAVKEVIDSYKEEGDHSARNQVLIQSQTMNVKRSGVLFTRNLHTNSPYYYINYDDMTGKTDTVTSGDVGKSSWLYRESSISDYPRQWRRLMTTIKEIENVLPGMVLDIEFAERSDGSIVIFQIRPLAANVKYKDFDDKSFKELLDSNVKDYVDIGSPFLSDMAFWNPSEIIGDNPHPLDYSLYREIITRKAWNSGLLPLGYTPVGKELMLRYGNKPYIDLESSFISLTPKSVSPATRRKLNAFYFDKLKGNPSAHDKIEFEIVLNCYNFATSKMLEELRENGFSASETESISRSLKDLTVRIIKGHGDKLRKDLHSLDRLSIHRDGLNRKLEGSTDPFDYIKSFLKLLEHISSYGTPQFAGIAREAFIASAFCKSLVGEGYFTEAEMNGFMGGMFTVASRFDRDFLRFVSDEAYKEEFLATYGHLRAGTYDITSQRYDRMDMSFFAARDDSETQGRDSGRAGAALDRGRLGRALEDCFGDAVSGNEFLEFIKSSIEQREYFKFEFTRSLSLAIELIAEAGRLLGFERDELCYLDVPIIRASRFYANTKELSSFWRMCIHHRKEEYRKNSKLILPPMISGANDFSFIESWESRPNFSTDKTVSGEVVNLEEQRDVSIKGKIVLLTKADPGFDWIFTQKINGLITKYGGAASHMAIRCAEFNLPAAIGCGDNLFNLILGWKHIKLDCKQKKILPRISGA